MATFREYDKDTILRWFDYRMTAEDRCALMAEHPEAYNRWVGKEIARVTRVPHASGPEAARGVEIRP